MTGAGGAVGGAVTISLTYSYLRRWQIESSQTLYGHVSKSRFAAQYQPVEACRGLAPGYISTCVEINQ